MLPGDWIGALATERGLVLDASLFATRFAAASDDREGVVLSGPPLASWDRPTTVHLPLPPMPPGGGWVPDFDHRMLLEENATVELGAVTDPGGGPPVIDVTVTCKGRDYGGPGVALGEVVTFWTSQTAPVIDINPTELSFGLVDVGDDATRMVTISNTGQADLVVTIPAPTGDIFTWSQVSALTIAPGTSFQVLVDFAPPGAGQAHGTLQVQSNAAGSPHHVSLEGTGKSIITPLPDGLVESIGA